MLCRKARARAARRKVKAARAYARLTIHACANLCKGKSSTTVAEGAARGGGVNAMWAKGREAVINNRHNMVCA